MVIKMYLYHTSNRGLTNLEGFRVSILLTASSTRSQLGHVIKPTPSESLDRPRHRQSLYIIIIYYINLRMPTEKHMSVIPRELFLSKLRPPL